jgi:hypothetical protein
MHMCVKGNDFVSLCHFFFICEVFRQCGIFLIFEVFRQCGIFLIFEVCRQYGIFFWFLKCSDNVVFFWCVPTVWYFFDFWSVPTVWYFFYIFEVFRQCGIFFLFLKCSDSVVFICFSFYCSICWNAVIAIMKWYMQFCCVYIYHRCRYFYYFPRVVSPRGYHPQSSHCFVTDMVYQI